MAWHLFEEIGCVFWSGFPLTLAQLCAFVPNVAVLMFLRGEEVSGAVGTATMTWNLIALSTIVGIGSGMPPLCAQAFGAGNYRRVGELFSTQLQIHAASLPLTVCGLWYSRQLLTLVGIPEHVAELASQFVVRRIPALPFVIILVNIEGFLVAQKVVWAPAAASLSRMTLSLVLLSILTPRYGLNGAAFAVTIAEATTGIAVWLLVRFLVEKKETWPSSWSQACFSRPKISRHLQLLSLALPSTLMIVCEWWAWEIMLLVTGKFLCDGDNRRCVPLDAFPVCSQTMVVAFMTHSGFSTAAGARVANLLGSAQVDRAKSASRATFLVVSAVAGTIALSIYIFSENWVALFTSDRRVRNLAARCMPLVAVYIVLDAAGPGASNKLLQGLSLVKLPGLVTFASFYLIGLPFGISKALHAAAHDDDPHQGLVWLWRGLDLGMVCMVVSLLLYLAAADFLKASTDARRRAAATPPSISDCEEQLGVAKEGDTSSPESPQRAGRSVHPFGGTEFSIIATEDEDEDWHRERDDVEGIAMVTRHNPVTTADDEDLHSP